ncbi:uncharacterized protein LOC34619476 [Cyclospora cayetanensis]|nr:uncharacterized protein LOC34619476 [Cyclospora cayetanensis]
MRVPKFTDQVVKSLRLLLRAIEQETNAKGYTDLPTEENFFGDMDVTQAAALVTLGARCGLYKRALRIRKHIFLGSKEGLHFGWGDRLAVPVAVPQLVSEYEEAFGLVLDSLSSTVPSMVPLLTRLVKEKRIQVTVGTPTSPRHIVYCPCAPSPLGTAITGDAYISPLTGLLLSFNYTPEAGAAGLAQFLWSHLMEAKLQELNPLMASFVSLAPVGPSSRGDESANNIIRSKSVLLRSNSLLIEAFGLWGKHVAFFEDINSVSHPHLQLRLLLSYLDETLGRLVKGSLRKTFRKRLKQWSKSTDGLEELEGMWLESFKDHFGPEGDVFDTFAGIRSQWLFSDVLEEMLAADSSNTAEGNGYLGTPPKPVHILAFMALLKVANDCYFIKGYQKTEKGRKPTLEAIAEAFETFVAEAERDGFVSALIARGAALMSPNFWNDALHQVVDKPILEAEMLARELSYLMSPTARGTFQ